MPNNFCFKPFQLPILSVLIASGVLISGCAGTPPPVELVAVSKAAVGAANTAGANELAPVQYKSAVEKMDGAEVAMAHKDYVLAQQLAEQAQVDAQLATAIARAAKAKKAADALQEDSRVLSSEIGRKTN